MALVKLILREEIPKLGHAGEIVSVKPGYARNYLLPQGKASYATEARISELEHHRRVIAEEQARALKDLRGVKSKVEGVVLEVEAEAGEGGKLFGSITLSQVAKLLKAQSGLDLDRRKMQIDRPIKTVGEHIVEVRLHKDLSASIKVVVSPKGGALVVARPDLAEETPTRDDAGLTVRPEAEIAAEAEAKAAAAAAKSDDDDEDDE